MYVDLGLFAKAEYLALFKSRFRVRRWGYILFFSALYWVMWSVVAFGRALDHLFFPGFKRQPVREPVFIVAPPRTGSTLTQQLMSLDEERFVYNALYQTIFPAVTFQRCFDAFVWLDRRLGKPFGRIVSWAEKKWFGGWDDLHKMRFNQPEEDDGFFVYTFLTEAIFLLFLHVDELWQAGFQDDLPPAKRRKVMAFYRSCLQRRLFASGPQRTILTKATQSSGAVESLLEAFPDAKFITIIRHPYESVASHVSVFWPVWQAHSPDLPKDGPVSKAYARLAVRWFQHLFEFRHKVDPRQYYCIDYRDLTRDPKGTLEQLYGHFGWAMSEAYREKLSRANARQLHFSSTHKYSLEEFGLTKEWLHEELGDLLEYYALDDEAEKLASGETPSGRDQQTERGKKEAIAYHGGSRLRSVETHNGHEQGEGDVALRAAERREPTAISAGATRPPAERQ